MTIHRFIVSKRHIDEANARITLTNPNQVHQISRVLRAKPGESFELLDGDGNLYICILSQISRNQVVAEIRSVTHEPKDTTRPQINVVMAILKGDQFELSIQKLSELGVSSITPCITQHTVVRLKETDLEKRYERWLSIATEATEQSEGFYLPQLNPLCTLEQILKNLSSRADALNIFLAERGQSPPLLHLLEQGMKTESTQAINLIVGPEGGFSDQEFELARTLNFQFATLGKRVFKAGTASILAAGAVNFFLDNMLFRRNIGTA